MTAPSLRQDLRNSASTRTIASGAGGGLTQHRVRRLAFGSAASAAATQAPRVQML
jgi:hypothetical protein